MHYTTKFFEKEFHHKDSKTAYLKACKWAAKHIVSTVEIGETFWKIVKKDQPGLPTFKLELFAMLDDKEHHELFCNSCRDFHKLFYINENFNCDRCNMKGSASQLEKRLKIKQQYRLERLEYLLNRTE